MIQLELERRWVGRRKRLRRKKELIAKNENNQAFNYKLIIQERRGLKLIHGFLLGKNSRRSNEEVQTIP